MLQPRHLHLLWQILPIILALINISVEGGLVRPHKYYAPSLSPPVVEVFEVKRQNVEYLSYTKGLYNRGQRSGALQQINVTRNSDLLFGEVAAKDSALLLQCDAPYSIQWVYKGDGDPEFNTNTTTDMDRSSGAKIYSAYLFLGSRRELDQRETGKYLCTSVRNKNLFSFVYLFVTGSTLFTNKGLEMIHYSKNDDSVRLPCSLSDPRATTTLQKKSSDGVLQCPMNETVRFDAKQGFILFPHRLHEPEGNYLCIADYNNSFQIIKYTIVKDSTSSGEFEHPPEEESSEFEPGNWSTPGTTTLNPIPPGPGDCPRTKVTCGLNAYCHSDRYGPERCRCLEGFGGNPYVECRPNNEITTTPEPHHSTDSSGAVMCNTYDDCDFDRACYKKKCVDPCVVRPVCGPHTTCTVSHHTPVCECEEGFEGDPYSTQEGQRCQKRSHCNPNPCGPNSLCKYVNGIISCSCEDGYATQHDGVCRAQQKNELNQDKPPAKLKPSQIIQSQSQQKNPLPRPLRNRTMPIRTTTTTTSTTSTTTWRPPPYSKLPTRKTINNVVLVTTPLPPGKECHYDADCPDNRMCIQDKCEDPCVNACGRNAQCITRNHFPRCSCPQGTIGDPFYICTDALSGPSSSSLPISPSNLGQGEGRYHANCGGRYSPCGPNSVCQMNRNKFVCACPNEFLGDPYSSRGCYSEIGYQKCTRDEDCPHFLTCLRYRGCVNPCNVLHVCQPGRSCVPHLHKPACLKTSNFEVELPRDGLDNEGDELDELEISEIPEEVKESKCFLKARGRVLSPCGRNTICYDNALNGSEPYCGCMKNYVGDPFLGCEPIQSCKNASDCNKNENCMKGVCRMGLGGSGNNSKNKYLKRNPCSPTPCNFGERCAIVRETNSASCIPPGKSLDYETSETSFRNPTRYLSRSDLCGLTGECSDEDVQDDENTTELASDVTVISSTTGISSSLPSLSSASIEDNLSTKRLLQFADFILSYSNQTTPVSLESTVVDA